jgi:DNA-directed RNA polymerase subunit delta
MSIITEKISYLKGLAEGLKVSEASNEGKLLSEILGVLEEISDEIEYLNDSSDEIFDRVYDLEDEVFGEDSGDYDYFDDDDEEEQFSIKCPNCNTEFFIDDDDLDNDEDILCPSCNEPIELEFGCECACDCENKDED